MTYKEYCQNWVEYYKLQLKEDPHSNASLTYKDLLHRLYIQLDDRSSINPIFWGNFVNSCRHKNKIDKNCEACCGWVKINSHQLYKTTKGRTV